MRTSLNSLRRATQAISSRGRNIWYRMLGMKIHGYAWLRKIDVPRGHHQIHLGNGVALDTSVSIICSSSDPTDTVVTIGASTYINRHTILDASRSVQIGCDCMIGPFCYITDHDHQTDGATPPAQLGLTEHSTSIGDRVWLGAHVSVLKGVNIGDDTVVGAGSVVTKDLPAGVVAVGNPARIVKTRRDVTVTPQTPVALEA